MSIGNFGNHLASSLGKTGNEKKVKKNSGDTTKLQNVIRALTDPSITPEKLVEKHNELKTLSDNFSWEKPQQQLIKDFLLMYEPKYQEQIKPLNTIQKLNTNKDYNLVGLTISFVNPDLSSERKTEIDDEIAKLDNDGSSQELLKNTKDYIEESEQLKEPNSGSLVKPKEIQASLFKQKSDSKSGSDSDGDISGATEGFNSDSDSDDYLSQLKGFSPVKGRLGGISRSSRLSPNDDTPGFDPSVRRSYEYSSFAGGGSRSSKSFYNDDTPVSASATATLLADHSSSSDGHTSGDEGGDNTKLKGGSEANELKIGGGGRTFDDDLSLSDGHTTGGSKSLKQVSLPLTSSAVAQATPTPLVELSKIKTNPISNNGQCLFLTFIDQMGRINPEYKKTTEVDIFKEVDRLKKEFKVYLDQKKDDITDSLIEGATFDLLIQQFNELNDTWYAVSDQPEMYGIQRDVREINADIISQKIIEFALDKWNIPIAKVINEKKNKPDSVLVAAKDKRLFNPAEDNKLDPNWITMIHVNGNHYNSAIFPGLAHATATLVATSASNALPNLDLTTVKGELKKTINETDIKNTEKPEFYVNAVLDALSTPVDLTKALPQPPLTYFGAKNLTEFLTFLNELVNVSTSSSNRKTTPAAQAKTQVQQFCDGLTEKLISILGENMNSPEYFSMFVLKLNQILAERYQNSTTVVPFDPGKDMKCVGVLKKDSEKPDTGFDIPEVMNVGNASVSICEVNGRRDSQEDQYHVRELAIDQESAPTVLKDILKQCEEKAKKEVENESGSTATLTHLSPEGVLTVAAVGDAPAMFIAKDKKTGAVEMIPLTHDHEPRDFFEKSRIYKEGGIVCQGRVDGVLNLTRAIGDFEFKKIGEGLNVTDGHISAEPDVVQIDVRKFLNGDYEVCVLTACDGILNHGDANRQNYADLFGSDRTTNFAQRCVSYALNSDSTDNITVIAAELNTLPEKGILMGVFDGHGGKQTSQVCKDVVENWPNK